MAYEKLGQTDTFTAASTGLRQYRFVSLSTAGVGYPNASTVGQAPLGVIISSGSAGSTSSTGSSLTVALLGGGSICKVEAEASTLSVGAFISASSVGRVQSASNAGDFVCGRILQGSSGAANRLVTIQLAPFGSTVAVV